MFSTFRRIFCLVVFTIFMSTHVYAAGGRHDAAPYDKFAAGKLFITGDGIAKDIAFSVKELEAFTEGRVTDTYTMRTLVEAHHDEYTGVTFEQILKAAKITDKAKSVQITAKDGVSMRFTVEELTTKLYGNEINTNKLKAILAYAKSGKPLVSGKTDEGYDKDAGNEGGPLRLVMGQAEKNERNSPKLLQNIVQIAVSTKSVETQYTDIGSFYSWSEEAIYALTDKKAMSAEKGQKFVPEKEMSRAEFVKALVIALDVPLLEKHKFTFDDVKKDSPYAKYIEAAFAKGIVPKEPSGKFEPGGKATRNYVAVLSANALGKSVAVSTGVSYKDKEKIPGWAMNSAAVCENAKIFDNIAVGYFNGDKSVNKAESAVIIYRILNGKSSR